MFSGWACGYQASPDGSYYTVTGNKMWISNAEHAEIFLVFASIDLSLGYKVALCVFLSIPSAVF